MTEVTKSEPDAPWGLSVGLEKPYQIPDTDRVVNNVKLSVVHGEGQMEGTSWVRVDWGQEGVAKMDALAYDFDGSNFRSRLDGSIASDSVAKQLRSYLEKHPEAASKLKEELSK